MPYNFPSTWSLKTEISELSEQKQTHRPQEHFDGCQMGGVAGRAERQELSADWCSLTKQAWGWKAETGCGQ